MQRTTCSRTVLFGGEINDGLFRRFVHGGRQMAYSEFSLVPAGCTVSKWKRPTISPCISTSRAR